jgi:hypothetical protein
MLTVTATNLVHSDSFAEQIDLFGEEDYKEREKSKKKEETVDKIRQKHGTASILQGSVMSSDIGIFKVGYDDTAEKDN